MSYIEVKGLNKRYRMGEVTIDALRDVSFTIEKGELICVLGASGSGKSTCLNIVGGMDTASSGDVFVDGKEITAMHRRELTKYRRDDIGVVFQFYNLIQNLTALENVELAVQLCKDHLEPAEILEKVGLGDRMDNFPSQLSGGEQQRVSIARALAKKPKLMLCDEPTGALDYRTGKQVLKLLESACRTDKMTMIIITHNTAIAPMADKVIHFKSGEVEHVQIIEKPKPISCIEW